MNNLDKFKILFNKAIENGFDLDSFFNKTNVSIKRVNSFDGQVINIVYDCDESDDILTFSLTVNDLIFDLSCVRPNFIDFCCKMFNTPDRTFIKNSCLQIITEQRLDFILTIFNEFL